MTPRPRIHTMIPMGRLGKPEEVVSAAVFLASDECSFITGIDLPVDGGTVGISDSSTSDRVTMSGARLCSSASNQSLNR